MTQRMRDKNLWPHSLHGLRKGAVFLPSARALTTLPVLTEPGAISEQQAIVSLVDTAHDAASLLASLALR